MGKRSRGWDAEIRRGRQAPRRRPVFTLECPFCGGLAEPDLVERDHEAGEILFGGTCGRCEAVFLVAVPMGDAYGRELPSPRPLAEAVYRALESPPD